MRSNPITNAETPTACTEALDTLLVGEVDDTERLLLLFDAAVTYLELNAPLEAEAATRRIMAFKCDVSSESGGPSVREAAARNIADMYMRAERYQDAAQSLADGAMAALQIRRSLRAIQIVAEALSELPEDAGNDIPVLYDIARTAADIAPAGQELFSLIAYIGYKSFQHGNNARALEFQERALGLSAFGNEEEIAGILANQVTIGVAIKDWARVSRYGRQAAAALRTVGLNSGLRELILTASAEMELGRPAETLALIDEIDPELPTSADHRLQGPDFASNLRLLRAEALVDLKRYGEAAAVLAEMDEAPGSPPAPSARWGAWLRPRPRAKTASVRTRIKRLELRIERENSGPLSIGCAHRVLGMALGMPAGEVAHSNEPPDRVFDPGAYRVPDLTDADRQYFDTILDKIGESIYQTKHSENSRDPLSGPMIMACRLEYTDDVADFEQKWRLYALERAVQERRRDLIKGWDIFRRRFAVNRDVERYDVDEVNAGCRILAEICRELASAGDRTAFAPVAMFAADMLESWHSDPVSAAFTWTQRARVLSAALTLTGGSVGLLGVELRHCQNQFGALASLVEPRQFAALLDETLENWIDLAEDEGSTVSAAELADLALPLVPLLAPYTRLLTGVALSMAGRYTQGGDLIEAVLQETRGSMPDTPILYPDRIGYALAVASVLSHSNESGGIRAAYGSFSAAVHAEVEIWAPGTFVEEFDIQGFVAGIQVPPLAFSEHPLMVIGQSSDIGWPAVWEHEMRHSMFREGQTLKTADGRWRRVKRDTPVASAITYYRLLYPDGSDGESRDLLPPGMDGIRILANLGEESVRSDPVTTGLQIQRMLKYFDALGRIETPASYQCAALLAGMARQYLGDGGLSYLMHLEVTDHVEALQFGAMRAKLLL